MGFVEAVKTCLSKYFVINGRARRSEYWWFALLSCIISVIPLVNFLGILLAIPSITAGVRRLHDTDRSGWWWLLCFVPLVNLLLIYYLACEGTDGENKYGPNPKNNE